MRLFKSLVRWMDKDWKERDYNSKNATAQKLLILSPLLAPILIIDSVEAQPNSPVMVGALVLGGLGVLLMLGVSLNRWMAGYSGSEFQDQKAKELRRSIAERRSSTSKWEANPLLPSDVEH